jgi:hypothetical protein
MAAAVPRRSCPHAAVAPKLLLVVAVLGGGLLLLAWVGQQDPRLDEADRQGAPLGVSILLAVATIALLALRKKKVVLATCLLLVFMPLSCCVVCPRTVTVFEWKYRYRVKAGMTLGKLEAILGPSQPEEAPPGTLDWKGGTVPFVRGDEFYVWERDGLEIWVGLRGGRVCDKWFWAPSL